MDTPLTLINRPMYIDVQRTGIALSEKDLTRIRVDVDLANKPAWLTALSPLGKTSRAQGLHHASVRVSRDP